MESPLLTMVNATDSDFHSEDFSACSEAHLQLPLKLNVVGKKHWSVMLYNVV